MPVSPEDVQGLAKEAFCRGLRTTTVTKDFAAAIRVLQILGARGPKTSPTRKADAFRK